jgi:small ligand-binding sensory domain FIST
MTLRIAPNSSFENPRCAAKYSCMTNSAASRVVLAEFSEETVIEAARETLGEIGGQVSCALVFASADYREHIEDFLELIQLHGHVPLVVGCSGSGLIGTSREAEQGTGFSMLFLHLPNTKLTPFEFGQNHIEASTGPEYWHVESGVGPGAVDAWLVVADPLSIAADRWIDEWNRAYLDVPCLGGLASGGPRGDDVFVFRDHKLIDGGGIALALKGGVRVHPVVSQGCTPIGEPFTITNAEQNVVLALGSKPAYQVLSDAFESLPDPVKRHAQGNLFAGLATSEYIEEFKRGDFLIRNILGANPETGAVAIGAYPRVGQTMQYQLRDRNAADSDLDQLLSSARKQGVQPFASLLFCCSGRGKNLFGVPNHDALAVSLKFGRIPAAGFFCNGEIGPIGGTNFIHGYTASIALLAGA